MTTFQYATVHDLKLFYREADQPIVEGHNRLTFATLRSRLAGESQTTSPQHCVELWYPNSELIDMPNQICFHFPAFHQAMGGESETRVCLYPSWAEPVAQGLCFEGGRCRPTIWKIGIDFGHRRGGSFLATGTPQECAIQAPH